MKDAFRDVYTALLVGLNREALDAGEKDMKTLAFDTSEESVKLVEDYLNSFKESVSGWVIPKYAKNIKAASYFFGDKADSVCLNPIMYPDKSTVERCAMMHDTDTDALLRMWSRVKGSNASIWTYCLICIVLGGLVFAVIMKYYRKSHRRKRKH